MRKLLLNSKECCIIKNLQYSLLLLINLSIITTSKLLSLLKNSMNSLQDKCVYCQISFYYNIVVLTMLYYINTKI